jgi:hypothetical protein
MIRDKFDIKTNTPSIHISYNSQLGMGVGILIRQHSSHQQHTHHQQGKFYQGNQLFILQLYRVGLQC